jgi:hypothetical protein
MTLAVLLVTHLEAGAGEAIRIARVLPVGNLSTLAFLTAFRFSCPAAGVGAAMFIGYTAAAATLLAIAARAPRPERIRVRAAGMGRAPHRPIPAWRIVSSADPRWARARMRGDAYTHPPARPPMRRWPAHRGGFHPLVEALAS